MGYGGEAGGRVYAQGPPNHRRRPRMHVSSGRVSPLSWRVHSYFVVLPSHVSCPVVGSQVKSLYRHGHMSECRDKMEDFKFCMSLKSMEPDSRRDAWIRRRAEWWASRRLGKSSENVWDMRRCVIRPLCQVMAHMTPHHHREPLTNWPPSISQDAAQPSATIA